MTEDFQDELVAMAAAARSIQGAAEKAVAELMQLAADNRAVTAQIAREGEKVRQEIRQTGEQVLARISQGAEKAIREAAVSDVGAKIEAAIDGPLQSLDQALRKLEDSARTSHLAAARWQMFTRAFRWQQLALAVLAGILLGAAGLWYFGMRGPQAEAAEYLLFLKHGIEQKAAQAAPGAGTPAKGQRSGPSHKPKPKNRSEAEPEAPAPESVEPPQ